MPEISGRCRAVNEPADPIPWCCSEAPDHDGPHRSTVDGKVRIEWEDEA